MDALIIRRSALGDVICVEPFIRALKPWYEHVAIDAGLYQSVFDNHPLLTPQAELSAQYATFDLTHVYERNLQVPVIKAYFDHCNLSTSTVSREPKLYLTEEEKKWGKEQLGDGKWAVMDLGYPGGALARGFWEFIDWKPVCDFVKSQGFKIVYIGGGAYQGALGLNVVVDSTVDLDLRGKTNLRQLFSIIYNCSLFFGIDSGPMHIVQSFDIPGVGIFTPHHASDVVLNDSTSIIPLHAQAGDPLPVEGMIATLHTLLDMP